MVICLSGAHSCGKSTLVEFFRGKEGYVCVDSVTRSTISKEERKVDGVENLDNAQLQILSNISTATMELVKLNIENPDKVYLVDRCVFDFVAYTRSFHKRGLVSDFCLNEIESKCKDYWKYYDLVCYLPIEFDIVDDGVRSLDENLRRDVDTEIVNQLLWNPVKAVRLSGTVLQRVHSLQNAIKSITTH